MINQAVAIQYSKALLKFGMAKEQLESRLAALENVSDLIDQNPKLQKIMLGPYTKKQDKKNFLKEILGDLVDSTLLNFLFLLIDKGRLEYLPVIKQEYRRLIKSELGIIEARLITAFPVENELQESVRSKLEKAYSKQVEVQAEIVPEIIGGMILKIGNKRLDESIKEKLSKLKKALLAAKV
ncbi:MAG: ATP synthase F1 subunit delta [Candidatus Protochlamydia sp.]|nr:ATP synthase F1 subunit delta [Candidatus Protochlamydia sp.]